MEKHELLPLYDSLLLTHKNMQELAKINKRAWAKQNKTNKFVLGFIVAGIVYTVAAEHIEKKQNEKIDSLVKEIEELKTSKGE